MDFKISFGQRITQSDAQTGARKSIKYNNKIYNFDQCLLKCSLSTLYCRIFLCVEMHLAILNCYLSFKSCFIIGIIISMFLCALSRISHVSICKCYQIFWICLCIVKYDIHSGAVWIVDDRVI